MKTLKFKVNKVGNYFRDTSAFGEQEIYILSQVDGRQGCEKMKYALIGLHSGNRYSEPTADINKVFAGEENQFVQVAGNIILKARV